MKQSNPFAALSAQLEDVDVRREQVAATAFSVLEACRSDFSNMLINGLGDRTKAMRWMSMHHRSFGGRNAYRVLADGEADLLWEKVARTCGMSAD